MSKKIQLSIPTPCHEDWNVMTPVEKGKFCGSCQKQVVDFSKMSDRDIAQFFKKPATGSVCGRFMTDQLDRAIEIPRKRIPWLKYFFSIALPAFFFSKASGQKMVAMQRPGNNDTIRVPMSNEFRTLGMVLPTCIKPANDSLPGIKMKGEVDPIQVKGERGKVLDAETGQPIPGAEITMISTIGKEKYKSDKYGAFILNTVRKITVHTIEIRYPGYETKKLTFAEFLTSGNGKHIVSLDKMPSIMGDIEIIPPVEIVRHAPGRIEIMGKIAMPGEAIKQDTIKGRIMDDKGNPLPFASVVIKGSGIGQMANANGEFIFKPGKYKDNIVLVASSVGFESREMIIGRNNSVLDISFLLRRVDFTVGELVICRKPEIKKELKDVPVIPSNVSPNSAFKVFPNPVEQGASLNIEWKQNEEGYFNLQLLNQSGQQAWQKEVWIDTEAGLLSIDVPKVAAGSYFLVFTNKKTGKKSSEKIIIQ